jgi:hypothetical protein
LRDGSAEDTLIEEWAEDFKNVTSAGQQLIQPPHPMMCQRHVSRQRHLASTDQAHIGDRVVGARKGRVVTKAAWRPVNPATLWIRVVSIASAGLIAGTMVVSRRVSLDFPTPGESRRST